MSLQETLERLDGTPDKKDFTHELFELCMSEVDAGRLAFEAVPARMAHLSNYFSNVGGHAAVEASMGHMPTQPIVTTALMEKSHVC